MNRINAKLTINVLKEESAVVKELNDCLESIHIATIELQEALLTGNTTAARLINDRIAMIAHYSQTSKKIPKSR